MNTLIKQSIAITASIALCGCITLPKPAEVTIHSPFDSAQTLSALEKGSNTIKGSALLRQRGGGVVTCAGLEVRIYPVTSYSTERISLMYGSADGGFRSVDALPIIFKPDNEFKYHQASRSTRCDPQGFFKFDEVRDGNFFIITAITWNAAHYSQGGGIMKQVSVKGGEVKEIVLSPN